MKPTISASRQALVRDVYRGTSYGDCLFSLLPVAVLRDKMIIADTSRISLS